MRAKYRVFRGFFTSWEKLFVDAANFATTLGPQRVISISHSEDENDGVVTVWYWSDDPGDSAVAYAEQGAVMEDDF